VLRADLLPHPDIHEHYAINIDAPNKDWMRYKCVTLATLRNEAARM
jgi:hypothetical protein